MQRVSQYRVVTRGRVTCTKNAETIRLTSPEGKPLSITHLKPGDKVMAYTEDAGRYFGVQVKETIQER